MSNPLKYLGIVFLLAIILSAGFIGYGYQRIETFRAEIAEILPDIVKGLPAVEQYSALGEYQSCSNKLDETSEVQASEPVKARILVSCQFENGEADIEIHLSRESESEWSITKQRVTSDVFQSSFNKEIQPTQKSAG